MTCTGFAEASNMKIMLVLSLSLFLSYNSFCVCTYWFLDCCINLSNLLIINKENVSPSLKYINVIEELSLYTMSVSTPLQYYEIYLRIEQ